MKKHNLFGAGLIGPILPSVKGILAKRFVMTPFSVLNAREGAWQKRKRAWLRLGIQGASGRFNALGHGDTSGNMDFYSQKRQLESEMGQEVTTAEPRRLLLDAGKINTLPPKKTKAKPIGLSTSCDDYKAGTGNNSRSRQKRSGGVDGRQAAIQSGYKKKKTTWGIAPGGEYLDRENGSVVKPAFAIGNKTEYERAAAMRGRRPAFGDHAWQQEKLGKVQAAGASAGSSIFDPVLCELVYKWFCKPGGRVLDPFCGGSTSGIVGSALGYRFTGIDTRPEQIAANIPQAEKLGLVPNWICGDSEKIADLVPEKTKFDLIWTDPPYFDLEIYGGNVNDGSMHQTFQEFLIWYRRIFKSCVAMLKENRFLAIKVGEVRGKNGAYLNFVGETIKTFTDLGLHYYNEIILVTAAGSLPIRTTKQFQSSRKIGKTHQNILVFWKGDPKKIKSRFAGLKIQ